MKKISFSKTIGAELSLGLLVIALYGCIFYLFVTQNKIDDFTSFYTSLLNLTTNKNPYDILLNTILSSPKKLASNLNPPFFLFLLNPLIKLNYHLALALWIGLSFSLGLIASFIAFYYAFSIDFLRKKWLLCSLVYLSFYATLINITTAQIGLLLFFSIMIGYHFYLKKNDYLAGIFWGIIISIKFFPALLFFYALIQRRIKVIAAMTVTFILAFLIPLLMYGPTIYSQYYSMMSKVFWYGDNWNASLYGYLYRLFIDPSDQQNLLFIEVFYLVIFFLLLIYYIQKLRQACNKETNHQPFCMTIGLMLFISPLGWLYYFPVLIFPLTLLWAKAMEESATSNKMIILWLCSFMATNTPLGCIHINTLPSIYFRFFSYSLYFYGLLILIYLLATTPRLSRIENLPLNEKNRPFLLLVFLILSYGVAMSIVKITLEN